MKRKHSNISYLPTNTFVAFQVKHWMDPQLIPYGWGLFSEKEEVILVEQQEENVNEKGMLVDTPHNIGKTDHIGNIT